MDLQDLVHSPDRSPSGLRQAGAECERIACDYEVAGYPVNAANWRDWGTEWNRAAEAA